MINPHKITEDFEQAICEYTNSKYAVAVDSGTNALFLCLKYFNIEGVEITIPNHTYVSVPCSIINAGGKVKFKYSSSILKGKYQLKPLPVWDSALYFVKDMYVPEQMMCLSFTNKVLSLTKGGMILTDNDEANIWFRKARYHGRNNVSHLEDNFDMVGYNMYMTPEVAAQGLLKLGSIKEGEISSEKYQDLSKFKVFNED